MWVVFFFRDPAFLEKEIDHTNKKKDKLSFIAYL